MITRREYLGVLAAPLLAHRPAFASSFPENPVKIIVTVPPGGGPDALARIVGEGLSKIWKQPVVVENRPGATGMVGMHAVARSQPDGYTIGLMYMTHTVLPELFGKVPYDTAKDLAPITNAAWLYNVLVVPAASELRSLGDLVNAAKARPGRLTFGSGGNGSPAHLAGEVFCNTAGVKMQHVPYRGPAEVVAALMGNQVHAFFGAVTASLPLVREGKLRALAVTSPHRLPALPSVPTMAEAGGQDSMIKDWSGFVAPAGTPTPIIDQLNRDVFQVLSSPEVRSKLDVHGYTPAAANTSEQFGAFIRQELDFWGRFVRTNRLKPT